MWFFLNWLVPHLRVSHLNFSNWLVSHLLSVSSDGENRVHLKNDGKDVFTKVLIIPDFGAVYDFTEFSWYWT